MAKVFTGQISNTTLSIAANDGVKYVSIKNSSATAQNITIQGSLNLNGIASTALTLTQNEIITISAGNDVIDSLDIVSGSASALADVIASQ